MACRRFPQLFDYCITVAGHSLRNGRNHCLNVTVKRLFANPHLYRTGVVNYITIRVNSRKPVLSLSNGFVVKFSLCLGLFVANSF